MIITFFLTEQACPPGEFLAVDYYGDEMCKHCWCSGLSTDCKGVTKQAKPVSSFL